MNYNVFLGDMTALLKPSIRYDINSAYELVKTKLIEKNLIAQIVRFPISWRLLNVEKLKETFQNYLSQWSFIQISDEKDVAKEFIKTK